MSNRFLDEVHQSSFDIQKLISGEDILKNDNPNAPDNNPQDEGYASEKVNQMADYSNLTLGRIAEAYGGGGQAAKRPSFWRKPLDWSGRNFPLW